MSEIKRNEGAVSAPSMSDIPRLGAIPRNGGADQQIRCGAEGAGERTAHIEVCHGDHGPEPRFPGDCWTMWHVCSACRYPVSQGDALCGHCSARFEEVAGDDE